MLKKKKRATSENVNEAKKEIVNAILKTPKPATEIMKGLRLPTIPSYNVSKFTQIYLEPLEKGNKERKKKEFGFRIYKFKKEREDKLILKERWEIDKFRSCYLATPLAGNLGLLFEEFKDKHEKYMGVDLEKFVKELCKKLQEFELLANKKLNLTSRKGKIQIEMEKPLHLQIRKENSRFLTKKEVRKSLVELYEKNEHFEYIPKNKIRKSENLGIFDLVSIILICYKLDSAKSSINSKRLDILFREIVKDLIKINMFFETSLINLIEIEDKLIEKYLGREKTIWDNKFIWNLRALYVRSRIESLRKVGLLEREKS